MISYEAIKVKSDFTVKTEEIRELLCFSTRVELQNKIINAEAQQNYNGTIKAAIWCFLAAAYFNQAITGRCYYWTRSLAEIYDSD
jgi:hypothetical protein